MRPRSPRSDARPPAPGKALRRRRWQQIREQRGRGVFLLPALLTIANLFCGFYALLLTVDHRYVEASLAVFVAMVMDMLDGRVARLMKATSQFGVEFDSLADVVSFGVAPAFILYSFALVALPRAAWFGAALFAICGALRLARFNVQTGMADKRFFVGLPIPAAAGAAVSTVIALQGVELTRWLQGGIAVGMYVLALLMVSTFRYWSFKEIDFARRRPLETLLVLVLGGMIVATNHEVFLFVLFVGYAVSGPAYRAWSGRAPAAVTPALESPRESH
jgi:CDP-diacylglycerol--serine O-phosphatidyltransferase